MDNCLNCKYYMAEGYPSNNGICEYKGIMTYEFKSCEYFTEESE